MSNEPVAWARQGTREMKLQPYQKHMMKMLNKPDTKLVIERRRQNKSLSVLQFLDLLRKAQEK